MRRLEKLAIGVLAALAAFGVGLVVTGCRTFPPPKPIDGAATCADACDRGTVLGCPWAAPTPNGETCVEVCENAVASGLVALGLGCMASAGSCSEADACEAAASRGKP